MIEEKYIKSTKKLIDFIEKSPDCYHVVNNVAQKLVNAGFAELNEGSKWDIKSGGKYFTVRNNSSVIAFQIPENDFKGFMICASHSDSPTYKLKPNTEIESEGLYVKLNTEEYGGMISNTWMDRPLSVAGRVVVNTSSGVETRLVNIDRDLCVIPNIAIHMNRSVNKGYDYNPQKDMLPIIGDISSKGELIKVVAENINANVDDILGYDLFLYNRCKGSIWGINNEYFSIGKIDDLQSVYASSEAFINTKNPEMITVMAVFDNEEVGSGTKQGAKSDFLVSVLERINESLGKSRSEFFAAVASSMMLSADNAHAVHPNSGEKADPTNRPKMNGGVVIKYHAKQKYTTDGVSEAILKKILKKNNIPYQEYTNRSDVAGGSTLGNLSTEQVSLNTVDIGAAQLAMHSAYETGGVMDTEYMTECIARFYETVLSKSDNGAYEVE